MQGSAAQESPGDAKASPRRASRPSSRTCSSARTMRSLRERAPMHISTTMTSGTPSARAAGSDPNAPVEPGRFAERAFPITDRAGQVVRIAGVSQDITSHKDAFLELLRLDRRKDELLAVVAHELRSPLAPIRHAAALLA